MSLRRYPGLPPEEARYASYTDRKKLAHALRPIYTAVNADAAQDALLELADSPLGRKHKAAIGVWERAWDRFIPFLEFPPDLRKVIYTTNTIESLNFQLRKIIKNRGHFPTDDAVVKLLWLAICDIEDKRARAREADRGKPPTNAPPPPASSKAPSPPAGAKPSPHSPNSAKTVTSRNSTSYSI